MNTNRGFTMLQLMLVLVIITAAGVAAMMMFQRSDVSAAVRQEQESAGRLVEGIMGAYTSANNFSTLSTQTASGVMNIPLQSNGTLNSALRKDLTIAPSTITTPDDSFDLVYSNLSTAECTGMISALKSRSNRIFVGGSNSSLQNNAGQVNESEVASSCAGQNGTSVAFRFQGQKNSFTAQQMQSGMCAPEDQTQSLACPDGQSGSITQRRNATCSGDPATQQWSSWVTTSNTCSPNAGADPTAPVSPTTPDTCVARSETRSNACPSGQVGVDLQRRTYSCATNAWSDWASVSSSCQPEPNRQACTPATQRQTVGCPAGQGGQIIQERASTCSATGTETWSNWNTISNSCSASCAVNGTCCQVSRQYSTEQRFCGVGRYGSQTADLQRSSVCASSDATPQWPSQWSTMNINGTCTTCPSPAQEQETQSVPASAACPSGQLGTHSWTSNQVRTRTRSYDCSSDRTTTLPNPSYSAWSGWSEVSRSNEVNTCTTPPPASTCPSGYVPGPNYYWYDQDISPNQGTQENYTAYNLSFDTVLTSCFSGIRSQNSGFFPGRPNTAACACDASRDGVYYQVDQTENFGPYTIIRTTCQRECVPAPTGHPSGYVFYSCSTSDGDTDTCSVQQQAITTGLSTVRVVNNTHWIMNAPMCLSGQANNISYGGGGGYMNCI